ncbi:hypothetical protein K1T71_009091 [Dendrolimus kikuchii]|uniref:Uncharacterized protein n=1 Tax=Dendrolimus kikuchii TaxID=765133 RepID=A0ACC1CU33_9NEOP|nr:hypothetical protein K1T71_009091 [Dendrolimus kikuchii]
MGFDEGQIVLDSPNGAYYPGQTVRGKLEFDLEKVKKFRGIYIELKGWCKVHWTTTRSRRVRDRRETYTVSHDSHEEYFNTKIYLVGATDGEHHLQPGHYSFPFEWHLPVSCPSSFEGSWGRIRYQAKAVVDRAFKFDQEKKAAIRVIAPIDMNLNPMCSEPIEMGITNSYCCWCISSGSSETVVKLPVSGYCPGQVIPLEVYCKNSSNFDIYKIKLTIKREIYFRAEHHPGNRTAEDEIAEIKTGEVPGNTERSWTIEMEVPAMDVYNFDNCRYIDVNYFFKATVVTGNCHEDGENTHRIIIGSIPLRGFQDNVENPMKDQMPSQPYIPQNIQGVNAGYPIVNQPLPTNTPYPVPNYPNGSPYPSSYPHPNQAPYPLGNPGPNIGPNPYGGSATNVSNIAPNMGYPGGSPYIGPNQYPGSSLNLPNIAPNPYGGSANNLSNVGPNSPYPIGPTNIGANLPYPNSQSPYNSRGPSPLPYPTGQSPNVQGTFLKTGTVGFAVQTNVKGIDDASVPLLPPGAGVPHPPSSSPNPYASASAPEPCTPDKEEKTAPDSVDSSPNAPYPYNPNYHETKQESPKDKDDKQT